MIESIKNASDAEIIFLAISLIFLLAFVVSGIVHKNDK